MYTIITSKENEYAADFVYASPVDNSLMIRIFDRRRIPIIAEEFDCLEYVYIPERDYKHEGFTRLVGVSARSDGKTDITLAKEV